MSKKVGASAAVSFLRVIGVVVIGWAFSDGRSAWARQAAPPNDNFANAITIPSGGGTVFGSNVNATSEPGEPIHASWGTGNSVWWKWTPTSSGWVTISTNGSMPVTPRPLSLHPEMDTVVGVYTGSFVSALTEVTSGDNAPSGTTSPYLLTTDARFEAVPGTTYYIAVDSYFDPGSITLSLTIQTVTVVFPVPPADFDSTAASWTLDPPVNGSQWAFDATPSTFPSGISRSGVSLNFNNGTDYAGYTFGRATSPSMSIAGPNPVLEFWCNYDTETRGTQYDQRFVRILNGTTGALLKQWQLASVGYTFSTAGGPTDSGPGPCGEGYVDLETGMPATAWHRHRIFLDPAWTMIQVQFYFNSVDDVHNNYAGWAIDDLVVKSHPTAAPTGWPNIYVEPSYWTGTGVRAVQRTGNLVRFSLATNNVGSPGVHQILGLHPQAILDRSFLFYDPNHGHFHMSQYSESAIWRDTGVGFRKVARGRKRSFCQEDTGLVGAATNSFSPGCGASYQAISYGWRDVYGRGLPGQEIDVTSLATGVPYYLTAVVDPLNRIRETSNTDQVLAGQFTLPAVDTDPIAISLGNPFPQTSTALSITSATIGTSPAATNAVHVVGTGFDTSLSLVLYGSTSTQITEAPMYMLTSAPSPSGATDMWVDIPSGFPNPVSIDVLRASGDAASFRISGTPSPAGLAVDPALGPAFSIPSTGPFTAPSSIFYLTNTSAVSINWTATKNEFWTNVSPPSGTLAPSQTTAVTVSIPSPLSNPLAPGTYGDLITFANISTGIGSTSRSVSLTVTGAVTPMVVSPTLGLWSTRIVGGSASPAGILYTISNQSGTTFAWSATPSATWIRATPPSGTLAPGTSVQMLIDINTSDATVPNTAGTSTTRTVAFTSGAGSASNTTRSVTLHVTAAAPGLAITNPASSPVSTPSSPFVASGTTGGTSVSWTNLNTGASGNATITAGNWSASIPLQLGPNLIAITVFDALGNSQTQSFEVDYFSSGGGGGGHHGGCGVTGLEPLLLLGLAGLLRRRR